MTRVLLLLLIILADTAAPAAAQTAPQNTARPRIDTQECSPGFLRTDAACVLQTPANATAVATGGWTCNPGFHDYDGACRKVVVPAHAHLSGRAHSWACDAGFHEENLACVPDRMPAAVAVGGLCGPWDERVGRRCFAKPLPAHAKRLPSNAWICKPGFLESDGKCVPTQIPLHARIDASGDGWICRRGYQPADNRCVEIDVPPNATLGFFGDVWSCNKGFYELRGVCLPDTVEHKALVREQAALTGRTLMQISEPVLPRSRIHRQRSPTTVWVVGLAGVIAGTLVIFFQLRDPSVPHQGPTYKMSYVPRTRGSGTVALKWLSFGNRVDALTGASILPSAQTAQCRNCRAWYHAESMMTLRHENAARCVACGRAALGLSAA